MRLRVRAGARSDVGRVREHNEDAHVVADRLWAVADGMGGHAAGEGASALAIAALEKPAHRDPDGPFPVDTLVDAVQAAHEHIRESAAQNAGQRGMGTTLTGVALATHEGEELWAVFNVGDSRAYRLLDGDLHQITVDHSEVQELLDAGIISAQEAAVHPARNIITRSLGMPASVTVDVWLVPIEPEQTFLVCSDGLTNEVGDDELEALLAGDDPQEAADRLVAAALAAGGHDNVTVVVVHASAEPAADVAT